MGDNYYGRGGYHRDADYRESRRVGTTGDSYMPADSYGQPRGHRRSRSPERDSYRPRSPYGRRSRSPSPHYRQRDQYRPPSPRVGGSYDYYSNTSPLRPPPPDYGYNRSFNGGNYQPSDLRYVQPQSSGMYHFGGGGDPRQFNFAPGSGPSYPRQENMPPPRQEEIDQRRRRNEERFHWNDPRRYGQRNFRRGPNRPPTSERALLRFQRGDTPPLLPGLNGGDSTAPKFRNMDQVTDSESESMSASDESTRREQPKPEVPKWSNPDAYAALPPPEMDSTDRKKRDIVRLIRKAKVVNDKTAADSTVEAKDEDFIKFDFSDAESEPAEQEPPPNAPSGPRAQRETAGVPTQPHPPRVAQVLDPKAPSSAPTGPRNQTQSSLVTPAGMAELKAPPNAPSGPRTQTQSSLTGVADKAELKAPPNAYSGPHTPSQYSLTGLAGTAGSEALPEAAPGPSAKHEMIGIIPPLTRWFKSTVSNAADPSTLQTVPPDPRAQHEANGTVPPLTQPSLPGLSGLPQTTDSTAAPTHSQQGTGSAVAPLPKDEIPGGIIGGGLTSDFKRPLQVSKTDNVSKLVGGVGRKRKRDDDDDDMEFLQAPVHKKGRGPQPIGSKLPEWSANGIHNPIPWYKPPTNSVQVVIDDGTIDAVEASSSMLEDETKAEFEERLKSGGTTDHDKNSMTRLHDEIVQFHTFVKPRDFERKIRFDLLQRLQDVITHWNSTVTVYSFGSFAAGLYLPNADIDVVLISGYFRQTGRAYICQRANEMHQLGNELIRTGIADKNTVEVISKSRVPIIKYVDLQTRIKVDISFENMTGIVANTTYEAWKASYPQLPILAFVVKQILMMHGLNNVATGGIGGFSTTCVIVYFLHRKPEEERRQSSTNENFGMLLLEFLHYFGNIFNMRQTALKMNPPGTVDKRYVTCGKPPKPDRLTILDPNDPANDIAGGSSCSYLIFEVFRRSIAMLNYDMKYKKNGSLLERLLGGNYNDFLWHRRQMKMIYEERYGNVNENEELSVIDFERKQNHDPSVAEILEQVEAVPLGNRSAPMAISSATNKTAMEERKRCADLFKQEHPEIAKWAKVKTLLHTSQRRVILAYWRLSKELKTPEVERTFRRSQQEWKYKSVKDAKGRKKLIEFTLAERSAKFKETFPQCQQVPAKLKLARMLQLVTEQLLSDE